MYKHIPMLILLTLSLALLRHNYLTRELPTVYINSEGSCIASKPIGLCYDKTLKEHNRVLLNEQQR